MAASTHYFSGTLEWAKLYEHNKDTYGDKTFFVVDVLLNDEDTARLKATGSRLKPKKEGENLNRIRFRRNEDHPIEDFGGPPQVIIEDPENPGKYIPFDKLIGNGSKGTVKVSVYDSKMGKGTRLEVVRVDEWVEFKTDDPTKNHWESVNPEIGVPF